MTKKTTKQKTKELYANVDGYFYPIVKMTKAEAQKKNDEYMKLVKERSIQQQKLKSEMNSTEWRVPFSTIGNPNNPTYTD